MGHSVDKGWDGGQRRVFFFFSVGTERKGNHTSRTLEVASGWKQPMVSLPTPVSPASSLHEFIFTPGPVLWIVPDPQIRGHTKVESHA